MSQALITVKLCYGAGGRETPWSSCSLHEDSTSTMLWRRHCGGKNGMFCMRESHWNGHFCLSPESDDGVRLKVLREHVYQFKLRSMIITLWRAQCPVPECVKAVIISKKRTMWESVSLPLCFRTESSQCAWVKVCASFFFFEPSQKKKQVKRCSYVWLLCPSVAHLSSFIFTSTFTSFFYPP